MFAAMWSRFRNVFGHGYAPIARADVKGDAGRDVRQGARASLVSLMQREQAELRQIEALLIRATELAADVATAQAAGRKSAGTLAVIAVIEDQLSVRRDALCQLDARISRVRQSISATPCKIIDLMQGATALRALPH